MRRQLGPSCLRIATYNVHGCVGSDGREDAERVAGVVRELGCDVVGLQEVNTRSGPGHASLQLDYLAARTGFEPIAGLTILRHDGHYGNALLTRHAVRAIRRHDLSFRSREPRGALDVDLDARGATVRVIVTHLGLRPIERREQVRFLLRLLHDSAPATPIVVLGDINEWLPIGRPLRWLHGLLGHAPAERSFPSRYPMFALDRVWVRPRRLLLATRVHASASARSASDHLPVKALIGPLE
jgi:endonuclease/exonuclease/phosphatase family metal-dependent hydrolase